MSCSSIGRTGIRCGWRRDPPPIDIRSTSSRTRTLPLRLFERIQHDAAAGRRYSIFDHQSRWPAVSSHRPPSVSGTVPGTARHVFGYTVNLDWAADSYFAEIAAQVGTHRQQRHSRCIWPCSTSRQRLITGTGGAAPAVRQFPLLFFDPATVVARPAARPRPAQLDRAGERRRRSDARLGDTQRRLDAPGHHRHRHSRSASG